MPGGARRDRTKVMWLGGVVVGLIGLVLGELVLDESWVWFAGLLVGLTAGAGVDRLMTARMRAADPGSSDASADPGARLSRSVPLIVLGLLGLVLTGVGAVWFASIGDATFGWFAYAPLTAQTFPDGTVLVTDRHRIPLVVCALGALLLSAAAGYAVGRRHAQRRTEQD